MRAGYFGIVIAAFGCSTSPSYYQQAQNPAPANWSAHSDTAPAGVASEPSRQDDSSSLEQLLKNRTARSAALASLAQNFTLGPGDLLRISVPSIEELRNRTVRVSEHDTVALPLLGTINVSGMTEDDLRSDLVHRLKKYMYQPQVEVFLQHTENREVAVLGSVKSPGRYTLSSHDDTIMTMISHAGGLTEGASSRLIFVPARANSAKTGNVSGAGQGITPDPSSASASGKLSQTSLTQAAEPGKTTNGPDQGQFLISLSNLEDQRYLDMP
ncbi:MAG: polysaccharide export protein, partial [Deltaproteobacteria bacterium]|nr:polysaccharide export protein [Deltaproteobacteria bacterium]